MNKFRIIFKNFLSLSLGGLITRLLFIVSELIIARYFGAKGFGQFSTALVFTTICGYFINFGIDFYLVKHISRYPEEKSWIYGNALLIKMIYALIVFLIMYILAIYLKYSPTTLMLIYIFGFYNVLLAFQETFAALFQAIERMGKIAFYRALQTLFLVG